MATSEFSFGLIRIKITDPNSSSTDLTNLAYNSLILLIPYAEKIAVAERKVMVQQQMKMAGGYNECDDCSDEDDEDCEHPNSKVTEIINKKISGLYA